MIAQKMKMQIYNNQNMTECENTNLLSRSAGVFENFFKNQGTIWDCIKTENTPWSMPSPIVFSSAYPAFKSFIKS